MIRLHLLLAFVMAVAFGTVSSAAAQTQWTEYRNCRSVVGVVRPKTGVYAASNLESWGRLPCLSAHAMSQLASLALEAAWSLSACLHFGKHALGDGNTIAYASLERRRVYMKRLVRARVAAVLGGTRQCDPLQLVLVRQLGAVAGAEIVGAEDYAGPAVVEDDRGRRL
jgi:hypothetical protein